VCDYVVEDSTHLFSCKNFASKKKIIEIGRAAPFLKKKKRNNQRISHSIFLTLGTKLILGCMVERNLHCCNTVLVFFFKLKTILITDGFSEITRFCVLEKKDKNSQ
jgi:hypothetical protein